MPKSPLYKKRTPAETSKRRKVNTIPAGKEFTAWTVVEKGRKPDYLLCKCRCGTLREVHVYSLSSGKSESCGCLRLMKKKGAIRVRS